MTNFKSYVIVDIDGTIAKVGDRLKYLNQDLKDWDAFYEACDQDEKIQEIIDLVEILQDNYNIIFCTGRRESEREKTIKWINQNMCWHDYLGHNNHLLMRPNGDYRHDTIVKPELLEKNNLTPNEVAFILEDRNSMVKKWRELGYKCLQVADGDF